MCRVQDVHLRAPRGGTKHQAPQSEASSDSVLTIVGLSSSVLIPRTYHNV